MLKFKNACYLPSGRIFLYETEDGYLIECTEMRDVLIQGKENYEVRNSNNPQVIWKHLDNYEHKWLLTVSTQKGCTYNCEFCDVANLPFKGNLSQQEIEDQVRLLLKNTPYVQRTNKAKIGFARMGEPAHNLDAVLGAMKNLNNISEELKRDIKWLPCFNSILPRKINLVGNNSWLNSGIETINKVLDIKENYFDGFLHFQISCNSTDESVRKKLFGGADVLHLEEVIKHVNWWADKYGITNRTVTLNFIVMEDVEVDVNKLKSYGLNGDRFTVKLIPLNNTQNSKENELKTLANYENYEKLVDLGNRFNSIGVPTVVDAIAKCEEAGLCCGQLAQIFQ
jgi:23S rRNA (adenine2503-C2)-methyltransferase